MNNGLHKVGGGIKKSLRDCNGKKCQISNCEIKADFGVQTWTGIYKPACHNHALEAKKRGYHVQSL